MNILVKKPNTPFGTEFTRFIDSVINEFPISQGGTTARTPVNIIENDENFTVEVQAPGWEKGDFSIKVENDTLLVSANNTVDNTSDTPKAEDKPKTRFIKKEFSRRSFKRSFTLSNKVNKDEINAEYTNGILKVVIAKSEAAKPVSKVVEIA